MPDTHTETRDFDPGNLLGESMHREIAAGARLLQSDGETTVDADRAVEMELAFSSEAPVERYWGKEILGHRENEIDLSRLRNGAPLLIDHDNRIQSQIGVVTDARVDADGIARARVKLSRRPEVRALAQDIADGILGKVSVGYQIKAMRLESEDDGMETYRVTSWTPHEVSLVAVAADDRVGIGRAAPSRTTPLTDTSTPDTKENAMSAPAENQAPAEQVLTATPEARSEAREEIQIRELGDYAAKRAPELGIEQLRDDFIAFGKPFDEFRKIVWKKLEERQAKAPAVGLPPAEIGMSQREVGQFSIVRAALASLTGNWKHAGLELEASRAVAERLGREARGFFVPMEVQRTMSAGNLAAGGSLVGETHRADLFIESLRAQSVAMQAGAQMLDGLVGNVSIPKMTGNATFYWLSEGEDVTSTDPSTGSINLRARTVAGAVPMTRRLLMQSAPSVEQLVREDLVRGAALAIDLAVFEGDGVKEPLGIVNTTDVNTVAVNSDGSPTWAEIVDFESAVDADNALMGSLGYVTTAAVRGNLKTTSKDTGSGRFLLEEGMVNGYPLYVSTQLTANRIIFGNFADAMIGMWGVLEVKPDEAALAASGGLVLRVFQDVDVGIRHGESFAYGT